MLPGTPAPPAPEKATVKPIPNPTDAEHNSAPGPNPDSTTVNEAINGTNDKTDIPISSSGSSGDGGSRLLSYHKFLKNSSRISA